MDFSKATTSYWIDAWIKLYIAHVVVYTAYLLFCWNNDSKNVISLK